MNLLLKHFITVLTVNELIFHWKKCIQCVLVDHFYYQYHHNLGTKHCICVYDFLCGFNLRMETFFGNFTYLCSHIIETINVLFNLQLSIFVCFKSFYSWWPSVSTLTMEFFLIGTEIHWIQRITEAWNGVNLKVSLCQCTELEHWFLSQNSVSSAEFI